MKNRNKKTKKTCFLVPAVALILCSCQSISKQASDSESAIESITETETESSSILDSEKGPYLSITYGRDNSAYVSGREMVYYTYDTVTGELTEMAVIPYTAQYGCGVVSRANETIYFSGEPGSDTDISWDSLCSYNCKTGEYTELSKENWSYNSITILDPDTLLVMACTAEHPIIPALFDLNTKEFTYLPDVNGETFDLYNCMNQTMTYNYQTGDIICMYMKETDAYDSDYLRGDGKKINKYLSILSPELVKDKERTASIRLTIYDTLRSATQLSENEILVSVEHVDPEAEDDDEYVTYRLYSLTFEDGESTWEEISSPLTDAEYIQTIDGGKTFYCLVNPGEGRGLYSYCTATGEFTPILLGNAADNGHVINFTIVSPDM